MSLRKTIQIRTELRELDAQYEKLIKWSIWNDPEKEGQ